MNRSETLKELKLFIYEENRDFSSDENKILFIKDVRDFIEYELDNNDNTFCLKNAYLGFLDAIKEFDDEEFLTMCTFEEIS